MTIFMQQPTRRLEYLNNNELIVGSYMQGRYGLSSSLISRMVLWFSGGPSSVIWTLSLVGVNEVVGLLGSEH